MEADEGLKMLGSSAGRDSLLHSMAVASDALVTCAASAFASTYHSLLLLL